MAGAYAVYHGPEGLAAIAARVHRSATALAGWLRAGGLELVHEHFFDTLDGARCPAGPPRSSPPPRERRINLRLVDADTVGGRLRRDDDRRRSCAPVAEAFGVAADDAALDDDGADALPADLRRRTPYLTHPVFSAHRSETAMLRYLRSLSRQGPRAGPHDDPAGLLHDEAQRRHRDGRDHLAGVRRTCTRSRRPSRPAATRS